ncbi:UNKNOWN [Stylonychia lemnae]|uniref:Uncharacterized protein n=1 Tax=Stylonychia lemnae TaxID=5949 RepID=A0A078A3W2_STYLE|nr:UNKNOWN [Stylonychia lemnae]|eukprot:CDW76852.1 UNKNOWN [Stylonychia lemnae]
MILATELVLKEGLLLSNHQVKRFYADKKQLSTSYLTSFADNLDQFKQEKQAKQENESIFGLMGQNNPNNYNELEGLALSKQNSNANNRSPKKIMENFSYDNSNRGIGQSENNNFSQAMMQPQTDNNTIRRGQSNIHSHAIVGSGALQPNNDQLDKDMKKKMYQDELQRQIRERDEIRKRENEGPRQRGGSIARHSESSNVPDLQGSAGNSGQTGHFPWQQEINSPSIQQASTFYPGGKIPPSMHQNAMMTKMDFPSIMTRGKVVEGRIDIELESRGTIFQGRDEKSILIRKKEDNQQAIREALQRQIDEKNRKKEEEKNRERQFEIMEEQRIKQEISQEQPITNQGRKTIYNNHNQVSIVGSGPTNIPEKKFSEDSLMRSPNQRTQTGREMGLIKEETEENIFDLGEGNQRQKTFDQRIEQQQMTNDILLKEAEQLDQKNKQINELSDMVKILLQEQQNLKEKLNEQEFKMKEIGDKGINKDASLLQRKQTAITKKASERTRSQNPPKKTIQSADNKSVQAKRLKEQHAIEQARLEAIENKIEKARKRIEETKQQKAITAQQTRVKLNAIGNGNPNDDINELLYGNSDVSSNQNQQDTISAHQHVPIIGGRHKSNAGVLGNDTKGFGSIPSVNQNKSTYQVNAMMLNQQKGNVPPSSQSIKHNQPESRAQKAPRGAMLKGIKLDLIEVICNLIKIYKVPHSNHHTKKVEQLKILLSCYIKTKANLGIRQSIKLMGNLIQIEGQFYSPNLMSSMSKKQNSPYKINDEADEQINYRSKYSAGFSQQNQIRPKQQMSEMNFGGEPELQGSKEFIGGGREFVSKNPSTAAGSYFQGGFGLAQGLTSGGGMGHMVNESFDLDIMMPPDVASIDSDLNKLSALTPTPLQNNQYGWGYDKNNYGGPGVIPFEINDGSEYMGGNTQYNMRGAYNLNNRSDY